MVLSVAPCQRSSPRGRNRKKPPIPKDWRPAESAKRSSAMQQRKGPAERYAQVAYQVAFDLANDADNWRQYGSYDAVELAVSTAKAAGA